ncbi:hypothetical protein GCM10023215_39160 [Pseudonocardia yuanmonensis]|uniref:Uncharacterized protein n=1 Tax=Pseudonocardia yuanmonensis TaxID=1095914 RepID=A0ABP8WXY8_9PSEU
MSCEYSVRVRGRLSPALLAALDPLRPAHPTETELRARVDDQAELQQLLARLQDLGIELVGLQRIPTGPQRVPRP